jgi:molybdate transport system substrate-binding protein
MRTLAIVVALAAAVGTANAAEIKTAEIKAFISTAIKSVTDELLPPFERTSGDTINAIYAPPGALLRRFAAGEPGDIFLTGSEAIDQLIGEGKVLPGRTDLATTGIGICVRKGAPKPDVSTPAAFKRALLAAASVAYVAPSGGSVTGPHIEAMFKKLGIAEQMAAKTKFAAGGPNGRVSVLVASGDAEIGLQQVSELLSNPDVDVIGMLPGDLQQITIYSAGITTSAKAADAARALIKALAAPSAKPIFKSKGLDPL